MPMSATGRCLPLVLAALAGSASVTSPALAQIIVQQPAPPVVIQQPAPQVVVAQPQPVMMVQQPQPVVFVQAAPPPPPPVDIGMPQAAYESLLQSMMSSNTRKGQRNIFAAAIKHNRTGISSLQIKEILGVLVADKDKLWALKLSAPKIVDRNNAFQILSAFTEEKMIIRARRILDKYR